MILSLLSILVITVPSVSGIDALLKVSRHAGSLAFKPELRLLCVTGATIATQRCGQLVAGGSPRVGYLPCRFRAVHLDGGSGLCERTYRPDDRRPSCHA